MIDVGLNDQIHIWWTVPEPLTEPELLARYRGLLSPDEQRRHDRFLFPADRQRFLVSHALLRTVLSRYGALAPEEWQFEVNRWGRPELSSPPADMPLRFNLSHTTGLAAVAVVLQRDVGLDVEDNRRRIDLAVADRYFAPAEVQALRALPAAAQEERFLTYWTLKEAYIKARGIGLSLGLQRFWFQLPDRPPGVGEEVQIEFDPHLDDDPRLWQFARHRPTPHHQLALAVRRGASVDDLEIRYFRSVPLLDES